MAFPLKRGLFFLFAILVLQASAALAVPLSSGMNGQDAAAVSATGSTADGEATEAGAGIVDNRELALCTAEMRVGAKSKSPGWLKPAAAVGAGSSIFAILASGGKGKGGVSAGGNGSVTMGSSGSGGTTSVGGGKGDNPPSAVPEPGTMLLMGLGVAGYLGRRKLAKK